MKHVLVGVTLCLCPGLSMLYAQDVPGPSARTVNPAMNIQSIAPDHAPVLSEGYYMDLEKRAADLDKKLQSQTSGYVARLSKKESRLYRRLYKIDSVKAKSLFAGVDDRYATYLNRLKSSSLEDYTMQGKHYLSVLDSMQTGISFLSHGTGSFSSPSIQRAAESAGSGLRQLQARFGQTSDIQEYCAQREQLLKDQLGKYGLGKSLASMNKEAYYYQQQLSEYKAVWRDPSKFQEKLLDALRPLPGFQSFWQKNSWLAQLFPAPAGLGTTQALAGLQTRADMQALLQRTAVGIGGGSDPAQYVQQQVQSAQNSLNTLKSKVSELGGTGGSGDMVMPDFKPDHQKGKSFFKRLTYGGNLQTTAPTSSLPAISDIGGSIGYRINDKAMAGIGLGYKVGFGRSINHISLSSQGLGFRSYFEHKAKGSIWLTGGLEYNYLSAFSSFSDVKRLNAWQKSALIGLSKKVPIGKGRQASVQALYDLLAKNVPGSQPLKFRMGWSFH